MNCIRCGRTTEGKTFCAECQRIVEVPLKESPYLSTRIQLPAKPNHVPAPKAEKRAKQEDKPQKKEKKRSRGGLIFSVVFLSVLCLGLAALCGKNIYDDYIGADNSKAQQILLQEENSRLSSSKEQLTKQLQEAEQTAAELRTEISEKKARISELEQELSGSRVDGSASNLALQEMTEEVTRLNGELATLTEKLAQCEADIASLQTDLSEAQAEIDALSGENSSLRTELSGLKAVTKRIAFINTDSKYYHSYDCSYFTTSKPWIAYNVSNAKQNGYTACPHCQ